MTTKQTNTTEAKPQSMASQNAEATPKQEPCNIIAEVLISGTRIGNLIYAKGAEVLITKSQLDSLLVDGSVRKQGIK